MAADHHFRPQPDALAGEQIVSDLLDLPYDMAVRIGKSSTPAAFQKHAHVHVLLVPVKNTDHGHLRDGFVRAMLARLKIATSAGTLNDEQAEVGLYWTATYIAADSTARTGCCHGN